MKYDSDQIKVVNHVAGPMLVVAGAGSGKTATIIGRAARLIEVEGVAPESHLMLTFSKKAADEMGSRIRELVPNVNLKRMVIGTFHSFGYRLIRERPSLCERRDGVTIMDESDVAKLIKLIAETVQIDIEKEESKGLGRKLHGAYSFARNELLDVEESSHAGHIESILEKMGIYKRELKNAFFEIFKTYEKRKRLGNLVDFDDLLVLPVNGMRRGGAAGVDWKLSLQQRFRFVTVDEMQDTNRAQAVMVELVGGHMNVTMVGDDDQSIYGWRGAEPQNMSAFQRTMNAKLVLLERNYRSTKSIIDAASKHVGINRNRFKKTSYAVNECGSAIAYIEHESSRYATRMLVNQIQGHLLSGARPKEIAVLYRMNRISRLIEFDLIREGIPYKIVGGINFEQRKEIRLALAMARLVVNEADEAAFVTVCDCIDGVGKGTVDKILTASNAFGTPLYESGASISARAMMGLERLSGTIHFLRDIGGPKALVGQLLSEDGLNFLGVLCKREKPEVVDARKRNLKILEELIDGWYEDDTVEDTNWELIFEKIVGSSAESKDDQDKVTLSTLHRAKGLEWKHCNIFGYSDGLMPLINQYTSESVSDEDAEDEGPLGLEEERRLSYVGITRAKETCTLWHCKVYQFGYEEKTYPPSRYLFELGLR